MIRPTTMWSRHDNHIPRAEKDRYRLDITGLPADEEDSCVAYTVFNTVFEDHEVGFGVIVED